MNFNSIPRTIETYYVNLDLNKVISAIKDIYENSTQIYGKVFDVIDTNITVKDGQIHEELSIDKLEPFLKNNYQQSTNIFIALFNAEGSNHRGFHLPPRDYVTIKIDMLRKKILLTICLVGADKTNKIAELFFNKVEFLNYNLPEEHSYIRPYFLNFLLDNPNVNRNIFLIMRFRNDEPLSLIPSIIDTVCQKYELNLLRADHKEYTDDLWDNVLIYLYGCSYGIAVFDQINYREFNPNVALEVGFMLSMRKKILLLKDQKIESMPSDIIGKIYKPFNTYDCHNSIPPQVEKWINDYQIDKH